MPPAILGAQTRIASNKSFDQKYFTQSLIEYQFKSNDFNFGNSKKSDPYASEPGDTLLHYAIKIDKINFVIQSIGNYENLKIDLKNNSGKTIFDIALQKHIETDDIKEKEKLRELLNVLLNKIPPNEINISEEIVLKLIDLKEIVLIETILDKKILSEETLNNIIFKIFESDFISEEMFNAILEKLKNIDFNKNVILEKTEYLNKFKLAYLIENNADFNIKDSDGKTPIQKLCDHENKNLIDMIIDKIDSINIKNINDFQYLIEYTNNRDQCMRIQTQLMLTKYLIASPLKIITNLLIFAFTLGLISLFQENFTLKNYLLGKTQLLDMALKKSVVLEQARIPQPENTDNEVYYDALSEELEDLSSDSEDETFHDAFDDDQTPLFNNYQPTSESKTPEKLDERKSKPRANF